MDSEPRPSPFVESLVHRTVFTPIRQGSAVAEAVARLGQAIAIGLLRPDESRERALEDDVSWRRLETTRPLTRLPQAGTPA